MRIFQTTSPAALRQGKRGPATLFDGTLMWERFGRSRLFVHPCPRPLKSAAAGGREPRQGAKEGSCEVRFVPGKSDLFPNGTRDDGNEWPHPASD